MKPIKLLLLLSLTMFTLTSATIQSTPAATSQSEASTPVVYPLAQNDVRAGKLNFFQRLMFKLAVRKYRKVDVDKADGQARSSLVFGITAMTAFLAGLFIPYIAILALPAGIVAIALGSSALSNGTNETAKARLGKGLGWGSVIALAAVLLLAVIIVASWGDW
jgi:hypothetical protein